MATLPSPDDPDPAQPWQPPGREPPIPVQEPAEPDQQVSAP
ncbi:MAG TPA: hypothetical protein VGC24_10530 [Burkholderiaceae bacterium]